MHLFIDTTDKITFGLLDNNFKWSEFFFDPNLVISSKLHFLIQSMLERNGIEFSDLESMIYVAGPGSYTGMRVAEGFAQIVEWQKMNVYSFYHYEIPAICGYEKGTWIANAFKGEFFLYNWDKVKSESKLIVESDLNIYSTGENLFSLRNQLDFETMSTAKMIEENSEIILKHAFDNKLRRELYYYRPLDQEFQKC